VDFLVPFNEIIQSFSFAKVLYGGQVTPSE
jgi:hypothetical protein